MPMYRNVYDNQSLGNHSIFIKRVTWNGFIFDIN